MSETKVITIPEYLMIKHYKTFNTLSSLDEVEQMIAVISAITGELYDDVLKWNVPSIVDVYKRINDLISKNEQTFHPVIEWEGQLYGFQPMSKMSLGEYIDLDTLVKDIDNNINNILALIYRPVTKNKINSSTFILKSTIKALKYEVENIFDYYDVEEYEPDKCKSKAKEFDTFPLDIALGAMAFFLGTKTMLSSDILISSHLEQIKQAQKKMSKRKIQLLATMAGFTHSMNLQKVPSYRLQETNALPI